MDRHANALEDGPEDVNTGDATLLGPALGLSREEAYERLKTLLSKHAQEWINYLETLDQNSFIARWAQGRL